MCCSDDGAGGQRVGLLGHEACGCAGTTIDVMRRCWPQQSSLPSPPTNNSATLAMGGWLTCRDHHVDGGAAIGTASRHTARYPLLPTYRGTDTGFCAKITNKDMVCRCHTIVSRLPSLGSMLQAAPTWMIGEGKPIMIVRKPQPIALHKRLA